MRRDFLIGLCLFALAFWHNLANVEVREIHRDEARWIHRAFFARDFFHPDSPTWAGDNILTLGQPPLGSYLMGVGLLVQGHDLDTNGFYNFDHNMAWNVAQGNVPSNSDLWAARRTNAFVGALTVLLVYFIGRKLANRVAGAAGALLLIPHPLNTTLSTFAGSDALLVFLVAAATLTGIMLAERPTWLRGILLGILIGLGAADKLTPIALAAPLALLGLALIAYGLPGRLRAATAPRDPAEPALALWRRLLGTVDGNGFAMGWMLLTVPIVAVAIFIASYPYLWSAPIHRSQLLFDFRTTEMSSQADIYQQTSVNGPIEAIERVRNQLGGSTATANWVSDEILKRFGHTAHWPAGDIYLGALGIALLAVWAMLYGIRSKYTIALIIAAGEAVLIILFMQVDFDRYHLPILLAVAVGFGFLVGQIWAGLCAVWNFAVRLWHNRRQQDGPVLAALPASSALAALPPRSGAAASLTPAALAPPSFSDRRPGRPLFGSTTMGFVTLDDAADPTPRRRPILLAGALGLGVLIGRALVRVRHNPDHTDAST